MSGASPDYADLVGLRVQVVLDPVPTGLPPVIEGTIYSINPERDLLVLMSGKSPKNNSDRMGFKVLRLSFVAEIKFATTDVQPGTNGHPVPDYALPAGITAFAALPTLQADTEPLQRRITSKKKVGDEARKYAGVYPDIAIRALDVLDTISRVYPDARWHEEKNCIAVGKDTYIAGIPNWNKPRITAGPDSQEVAGRIQKILEAKRT